MKRINLALQGGGAHGAFTWGVLERLLLEDDLEFAAISGTSAGALNAAALKSGWAAGGREGAIENLSWLWEQVGAITDPALSAWLDAAAPTAEIMAHALKYSPAYIGLEMTSRMFSPYVYGALARNPLERIVEKFHFDRVCGAQGPELFIGATNVRTGKIKLFQHDEISVDAILASACLPSLFQAVEITDPATGKTEAYWDGGYTGNPALFPLFEPEFPDDILIVSINPLLRDEVPTDSQSIANRINEISFNSSLLRELRAIDFVKRLISDGKVERGTMKDVLVHMIADDELMNGLNVATKIIPTPLILARLKAAGKEAADRFLEQHKDDLGERSSIDLAKMFS